MHELAVCQALLIEVERAAAGRRHGSLIRVVLRIGPLSGIEPTLLVRAFEIARASSCAFAAELQIEPAPVRIECLGCHAVTDAAPNRLVCAHCGCWHTRLLGGDELLLQSLEFTQGPVAAPALKGDPPCATPAAAM